MLLTTCLSYQTSGYVIENAIKCHMFASDNSSLQCKGRTLLFGTPQAEDLHEIYYDGCPFESCCTVAYSPESYRWIKWQWQCSRICVRGGCETRHVWQTVIGNENVPEITQPTHPWGSRVCVGWVIVGTVLAQLLCAVGIADQTLFLLQTLTVLWSQNRQWSMHGSVRRRLIFFTLH